MTALRANLLLLLAATIWGSGFVAQRAGMADIEPMGFNAIRFALGALTVYPIAVRAAGGRLGLGLSLRQAGYGLLAGLFLFTAAALQQVGLVSTTATNAGFLTSLYVPLVPIIGLILGHRVHGAVWLGVALCVGGAYLLSVAGDLSVQPGDLPVLASALLWALHVLAVGALAHRLESFAFALLQFLTCAVLSALAALLWEDTQAVQAIAALGPIVYAGVVSVGLAYTLQMIGQRHTAPAAAAIILSAESVLAAVFGWLLLGESLTARQGMGCALLLAGILVSQILPLLRARPAAEELAR